MSHTAHVATQVKSIPVIQRVCKALGLTCEIGAFTEKFYDAIYGTGTPQTGNVRIQLPGWTYPVLIDTTTGAAKYDNYNGQWGDITQFHNLAQEYSLAVARQETNKFALQGWAVKRVTQPNGDIQIIMEK